MTDLIKIYNELPEKEQKKLCREYKKWLKEILDWWLIHHHILTANNHGMGMKPDDIWIIPARDQKHHNLYHGIREDGKNPIPLEEQLEFLETLHWQFMSDKGII